MPRRSGKVPSYCHHKSSGRAVVRIDGRDHYLGPYGSSESYERYARLIAEWRTSRVAQPGAPESPPAVGFKGTISRGRQHGHRWYQFSYVGRCQTLGCLFASRARGAQARSQLERCVPDGPSCLWSKVPISYSSSWKQASRPRKSSTVGSTLIQPSRADDRGRPMTSWRGPAGYEPARHARKRFGMGKSRARDV